MDHHNVQNHHDFGLQRQRVPEWIQRSLFDSWISLAMLWARSSSDSSDNDDSSAARREQSLTTEGEDIASVTESSLELLETRVTGAEYFSPAVQI